MNTVILTEVYCDIPAGTKVEYFCDCYDSGYLCCEVKYKGQIYKPLECNCVSEKVLNERIEHHKSQLKFYKSILKKSTK
jgi:hypothetical protein